MISSHLTLIHRFLKKISNWIQKNTIKTAKKPNQYTQNQPTRHLHIIIALNPPERIEQSVTRRNDRRYLSHSFSSRARCALSLSPRTRRPLSTNGGPYLAPPRAERQCVLSSAQRDEISPCEVVARSRCYTPQHYANKQSALESVK